ncbi:MAG TPA: hypothetical protein VN843_07065 [Anaerolineales bacterium]|nr:hypothetical protein [Anaerolineales bacterium]
MFQQPRHEMQLKTESTSGAELWYCPRCGRRLLLDWEPKFKKTILEAGDEYAIHSGGKGGLRMGRTQIMTVNDPSFEEEHPIEDARLAPWEEWLEESDFEDLWDDEA